MAKVRAEWCGHYLRPEQAGTGQREDGGEYLGTNIAYIMPGTQ
jgi:hypothetical protein